ncbi:MAG: hypothetical protein KUG52_01880 [Immundisolibacteraceae bacterium]|nr:hypothetical protein [Immundisolibacteraceae bacterium]
MANRLPEEFSDLEGYVDWAEPTEAARMARRIGASMEELTDYYSTLLPRMEAIAAYLDQWDLPELPDDAKPLLYLGMMYMEAAVAVELFKDPDVPESSPAEKLTVLTEHGERALLG